jgi:hypothetical protein
MMRKEIRKLGWLFAFRCFPVTGDSRLNFVERQAELAGFHDEAFDFVVQERGLLLGGAGERLRHGCADRWRGNEDAFGYERGDDLVSCVGVDFEFQAKDSHGRKRVAGTKLCVHDGFLHCENDLFRDGQAGFQFDRKRKQAVLLVIGQLVWQENSARGVARRAYGENAGFRARLRASGVEWFL